MPILCLSVGKTYVKTSTVHIRMAVLQYNGMKNEDNDNGVDNINSMSVIVELARLGCTLPDELQVEALVNSFPGSWEFLVVSFNMSLHPPL